jgi:hypothetical protein
MPAKRPTSGASAAIGPPAAPVAMAVMASTWACDARSSTIRPTVMLP